MRICFVLILGLIAVRANPSPKATCLPPEQRFDCHPEPGDNQENCEARGCCYDRVKAAQPGVPSCTYPADFGGYRTVNVSDTENGLLAFLERAFPSAYPNDVATLRVNVQYLTQSILRVKIADAGNERYEAIYPRVRDVSDPNVNPGYEVSFDESQSGFRVSRKSGEDIFNSLNIGAFTFADQFLEISTTLGEDTRLFGIGEHRTDLAIKPEWKRFTLFNHDNGPMEDVNLYGSHPFYIGNDATGMSYGVFLHNSNAMDILLTPRPALTFRAIGGILDFYFFLGPTPEEVVQQYTSIVGRTLMPPYWGLGFHLCRYGYNTLERTKEVYERNRALEIPFDVQWNDIDYMLNRNDFTIDPVAYAGLKEFVDQVHENGMKYVMIIDPGISGSEPAGTYPPFDIGVEQDVLIKNKTGQVLLGRTWNTVSTAFPDFFHPKSHEYWNNLISDFYGQVEFDGIWIDMNEIAMGVSGSLDGCPDDNLENPPYSTGVAGDKLSTSTVCMNAKHAIGSHYDLHNLYSTAEAEATNKALRNLKKRPFVISRSTFSGIGQFTGHWSGDGVASWYDLQKSIQELLSFNWYGVSLMGADICGFRGNTNQALCNRWTQLGAFYTFCRNHNDLGLEDQDPAVYDEQTIASIRKSLNTRYTLLPYLYTLFYHSHVSGSTIARHLFFEYPNDPKAREVELAFLWGSGLYIIPVTEEGAEEVEAYLPAGRWFDWYTGSERNSEGETITLDAPYDTIPLLVRGGSILPTQAPAVTTTISRKNGLTLIVAPTSANGTASGTFYWDDGEVIDPVESDLYGFIELNFEGLTLTTTIQHWTTPDVPTFEGVKVLGVDRSLITKVTVNKSAHTKFTIDDNNVLYIEGLNTPANKELTIQLG